MLKDFVWIIISRNYFGYISLHRIQTFLLFVIAKLFFFYLMIRYQGNTERGGAADSLFSFANLPLLPFFLNFLPVNSRSSVRAVLYNGFTMILQRNEKFVSRLSFNNESFFLCYRLIYNVLCFVRPLKIHCWKLKRLTKVELDPLQYVDY